jgi:hypothetical protein
VAPGGPLSDVETSSCHFGDMGIALKGLLVNRCDLAICAGMSMNVPTAPNSVTTGLDDVAAANPACGVTSDAPRGPKRAPSPPCRFIA